MEPVFESFKKTNRAVIVEEGWKSFGVGSEISARIYEEAFDYVDAPIKRVAQKEVPLPYNRTLEQMALPQVEDVVQRSRRCCNGRNRSACPNWALIWPKALLVRWVKLEGEAINKGDVLAEIETDKATVEVESSVSGTVARHSGGKRDFCAGQYADCHHCPARRENGRSRGWNSRPVCTRHPGPESRSAPREVKPADDVAAVPLLVNRSPVPGRARSRPPRWPVRWRSMLALDLRGMRGSGPDGRIVKRDVEAA